jgi:hypothetical protein
MCTSITVCVADTSDSTVLSHEHRHFSGAQLASAIMLSLTIVLHCHVHGDTIMPHTYNVYMLSALSFTVSVC